MRKCILCMASLLLALPLSGDQLQPSSIQYLGYFTPPPPQGAGNTNTWSWGTQGLTMIPDCLGAVDPSPNDGYPGCIGAFGNKSGFQFGVFDIVPPGGQAQQVVPFYSLGGTLPGQTLPGVGSVKYWDVLYDKGPGHCRLWWNYGTWYKRVEEDPPFLGVSSCDPTNPKPQGMWDFGAEWTGNIQDDPFHTSKMYQGLSLIPPTVADELFDGKRMSLGMSHRDGTRGGSQGPSFYVRDLELPNELAPGPVMDLTPLLWYQKTNFLKWWDDPEMQGGATRYWTGSKEHGFEYVSSAAGDAMVVSWEEPIINPLDYPCSDPTAYRDNDPTTPEPCEVPVCWYGVNSCNPALANYMQPSFWEDTTTGEPMPVDCNISIPCNLSTGPHCLSLRPFLILYDIEDLAEVYRGVSPHNQPQPYAKIPLEDFFINGKGCGSAPSGSTYDEARQVLYVAQGRNTPAVHVFSIGGGAPPPTGELKMLAPSPGLPGQMNTLSAQGAQPGSEVLFVGSLEPGSTTIKTCGGITFNFGHARLLGSDTADSSGVANLTINIPSELSSKSAYLQVLDGGTCEKSNLVVYPFP